MSAGIERHHTDWNRPAISVCGTYNGRVPSRSQSPPWVVKEAIVSSPVLFRAVSPQLRETSPLTPVSAQVRHFSPSRGDPQRRLTGKSPILGRRIQVEVVDRFRQLEDEIQEAQQDRTGLLIQGTPTWKSPIVGRRVQVEVVDRSRQLEDELREAQQEREAARAYVATLEYKRDSYKQLLIFARNDLDSVVTQVGHLQSRRAMQRNQRSISDCEELQEARVR